MLDLAFTSHALGYLSILCWLGAQFPQVIVNIQTQSVEGLALPFLANWLLGDITNLVGCILTHQLPFQTYLASYFVFVDVTLVAQYIYYYKPSPPTSPSVSLTPSPTLSPAVTLTPTGVIYAPRSLTRPHSRTPLLSIDELEAGHRAYDGRERSHPRAGSIRFTGVMAAYPPAGLLPSSEELHVAASGTVKARKSLSKPSINSLRLRLESMGDKGKEKEGAHRKERTTDDGEEDDEVTALTDSVYSEASVATTSGGRRVSWSRGASHITMPRRLSEIEHVESPTGETTPTPGDSEARQRSRSRGRPSRRSRLGTMSSYEGPATAEAGRSVVLHGTDGRSSHAIDIDLEAEQARERERASKSGSRKRSASIVFLSVGIGALFMASGGGGVLSRSTSLSTGDPTPLRGEVLTWAADVEEAPRIPSLDQPVFYSFQGDSEEDEQRKGRPRREQPPLTREQKRRIIGRISAWACTTLYLTSRLPQIWKNYTRKSVQGLSLALFVFAFLGNSFYVASILSNPILWEYAPGGEPIEAGVASFLGHLFGHVDPPYRSPRATAFIRESLPYLLGSGGTLCFDVIIVTQGIIYGRREQLEDEEDEEDEEEGLEEEIEEVEQDGLRGLALRKDAHPSDQSPDKLLQSVHSIDAHG